ncbi:MAG: exopolyphosphatase [Betaproteobacteria bacterium]|nr:exopolyphosphatase [Betaproteobacteria bacterium]MDE2212185.1 exopolyphosphatase [Betaproteobacteria bacterium]
MSHSVIAAVDLGSNSFRLQVSRVVQGQPYTLDALKEPVRLAAGLLPDKTLSEPSQQRALACLERFGERLRGVPRDAVRAVGTNALRVAKNAPQFLQRAEAVLGVPIEIIAGHEEARLIYVGVTHSLPHARGRRLVVDIGGGSTEFIIGRGHSPQLLESLYMGCVSFSARYFPGGKVTAKGFRSAQLAAAAEMQVLAGRFRAPHWDHAVGSSGTARALAELLEQNGFAGQGITPDGLAFLRTRLLEAGDVRHLGLAGLRPERAPVLPGGMAIMCSVFDELGITRMQTTESGLREGVLYELLGRFEHQDIREATVQAFAERYQADPEQARRVARLALTLFRQAASPESFRQYGAYLRWAAALHEIGMSIAHGGYHRHSAYIIDNADMPGFSKPEQAMIGGLLQGQRGRLPKVASRVTGREGWLMVLCLRLAVLIHRDRSDFPVPRLRLHDRSRGFALSLSGAWLARNALTQANLASEMQHWQDVGLSLRVETGTARAGRRD